MKKRKVLFYPFMESFGIPNNNELKRYFFVKIMMIVSESYLLAWCLAENVHVESINQFNTWILLKESPWTLIYIEYKKFY